MSSEMSQTRDRSCDSTHARASSQIHRDRKGWGPGAGEDGECLKGMEFVWEDDETGSRDD